MIAVNIIYPTDDRNGFAGDPRRAYVRHTVMWSEPLINAARNPAERFFHLMLHSTSTLITTSISSHRLKYLTTNTHTWRQIQNLNWSRCSEYGVRNWRHTRICGRCQIPISAGTAVVKNDFDRPWYYGLKMEQSNPHSLASALGVKESDVLEILLLFGIVKKTRTDPTSQ